jgi:hypothetical protein
MCVNHNTELRKYLEVLFFRVSEVCLCNLRRTSESFLAQARGLKPCGSALCSMKASSHVCLNKVV